MTGGPFGRADNCGLYDRALSRADGCPLSHEGLPRALSRAEGMGPDRAESKADVFCSTWTNTSFGLPDGCEKSIK